MAESKTGPHRSSEPDALSRFRAYFPLAACVVLLAFVLGAFQVVGTSGRRTLEGHRRYTVADSQEGFQLLRRLGVRGRTLVLFDRSAHIREFMGYEYVRAEAGHIASSPVTPDDYVTGLIATGIARQVYVVMTDADWAAMMAGGTPRGDFMVERGRYFGRLNGAPIIWVTPQTLPKFNEKVIAYVPKVQGLEYPPGLIDSFDVASVSDIFITQEGR